MERGGATAWRRALLLFCAGLAVTAVVVVPLAWQSARQTQDEALHITEIYSARTEALLGNLFHKTDVLESIVITGRGELPDEIFQDLARALDDAAGIRAIQCLPGGSVDYCYPREGNEGVMGNSVFDNPKRRDDAILAVTTREIALSGPYELTQGGLGLVARNPIFFTENDGEEVFWGFSAIILDLPAALEPIMLGELEEEGYDYRLHCISETGADLTIAQSAGWAGGEAVSYDIKVPNHVWSLDLTPRAGWVKSGRVLYGSLLGVLVSLLCAVVLFEYEERTRSLNLSANTDELTGVYNRRWLEQTLNACCGDPKSPPFVLLYLDLDRFKEINDTLGHTCGDELLREIAQRVRRALGPECGLARVGGDEFVVIVDGAAADAGCGGVAGQIDQAMAEPFLLAGGEAHNMSISIGCAQFPDDGRSYDSLISIADNRMYRAKAARKAARPRP